MSEFDNMGKLFIVWAFFFQIVLIIHFAIRKRFFKSYTLQYGWIVYALCIPAAVISVILMRAGKNWFFWIGGFLLLFYSAFGFLIDYVMRIQWRNPIQPAIMIPYVSLYLGTIMFYWWPLGNLRRPLWFLFGILFAVGTILNITSH